MVLFNYSTRELTAKIVYYGPGLCGKTTNLQHIFDNLPGSVKGKMLSLATKTDRTLFFDFLPLDLGEIRGMKTRIQLYTVPGQVFYNETRRLVLKGADGVVFVADSQKQMSDANIDSFRNLEENLRVHSMKLTEMPLVLQYNKRDLPNLLSIEDLNAAINRNNSPFYESVATTGIGVQDTLKAITKLVLLHLTRRYDARKPAEVAVGSSVSIASAPSETPASATVPSRAAYAATPTPSAVGTGSSSRLSATARGRDATVEPEEEILELTEEYEDETTLSEVEPIELEDEIDGIGEPIAARSSLAIEDVPPRAPSRDPSPAPVPSQTARGAVSRTTLRAVQPAGTNGDGLSASEASPRGATTTEAARLVVGQESDLLVPVEIESDGRVKRYTLSIRIRLTESSRP